MAEHSTQRPLQTTLYQQPAIGNTPKARVRSSSFKYYIHDSCAELRLKLIGEMTESEVAELNGCWHTAKTTLGKRKLTLDLRSLKMVDEAARNWLAGFSDQGACYVPEDFLKTCVPGKRAPHAEQDARVRKSGLLAKVASLFRGANVPAAESSTTRAQ